MATVLLAVAISIAPTRSPTPSCPPLFPLKVLLMPLRSASKPPYSLIRAHIADTSMATMLVSNIPDTPEPILPISSYTPTFPVARTITVPDTIPVRSTRNTLKPAIPPISTRT